MGNEISQESEDSAPPRMVLSLDAFSMPHAAKLAAQAASMEPEAEAELSPREPEACCEAASEEDYWCASVLIDGFEVPGGRIYTYPSSSIVLEPRDWGSQLQLQFFPSPSDYRPRSTVSVPLAKLVRFGAPLYTSLWLGLNGEDTAGGISDEDLSDAMLRSHIPDAPKIKITIFRPAGNHDHHDGVYSSSRKLEPDIKSMFDHLDSAGGLNACIAPEPGQNSHSSKTSQVDGLIRCLDETNELIRGFHEAVMLKPIREKLTKDLQRDRNVLQVAEEKRAGERNHHGAAIDILRRELSEVRTRNNVIMAEGSQQHMDELQWKLGDIAAARQMEEDKLADICRAHEADEQDIRATLAGGSPTEAVDASMSAAKVQWDLETHQQLAAAQASWQQKTDHKLADMEHMLSFEQTNYDIEVASLQMQIKSLHADLQNASAGIAHLCLKRDDSSKMIEDLRSRMQTEHDSTLDEVSQHIHEQIEASELQKQQEEQELHEAKNVLQKFIDQREAEQDAIKTQHLKEAVELAKQSEIQDAEQNSVMETRLVDLALEHRLFLERQHEQWQEVCRQCEQQFTALQGTLERQRRDVEAFDIQTKLKKAEIAFLNSELPNLRGCRDALVTSIQQHEENGANEIAAALAEAQKLRNEGEQENEALRRSHASELHSASEAHLAALVQHDKQRDSLRQELANLQDETERQCTEITRTWEAKHVILRDALNQASEDLKLAEEETAKNAQLMDRDATNRFTDSESQQNVQTSELQKQLEFLERVSEESLDHFSLQIKTAREESARDEIDSLEDAAKQIAAQKQNLAMAHEDKEQELQEKISETLGQRDDILAQSEADHDGLRKQLLTESERLAADAERSAAIRQENEQLAEDLKFARAEGAEVKAASDECAVRAVEAASSLEAARCVLAPLRQVLHESELKLQRTLAELDANVKMQDEALSAAKQDQQGLEADATSEVAEYQKRLEELQTSGPDQLREELKSVRVAREPELEALQNRLTELQDLFKQQKVLFLESETNQRTMAEAGWHVAASAKQDVIIELKKVQDKEQAFRLLAEERTKSQRMEVDNTLSSADQKAEEELQEQERANEEEVRLQIEKHTALMDHSRQDHEAERTRTYNILAEQEKIVESLHAKIASCDSEKSSLASEAAILNAEAERLTAQHDEELNRVTAKHRDILNKQRESSDTIHTQLQIQSDEKSKVLAQQLKDAKNDAEELKDKLDTMRAEFHEVKTEATCRGEADRSKLGGFTDQLQRAEEGLQQEQVQGAQLVADTRIQAETNESLLSKLADNSQVECVRLKLAIESAEKEVKHCSTQILEAREQLLGCDAASEKKSSKDTDLRVKRFEQETATQEMAHRSELEAAALAAKAAFEAHQKANLQEVQGLQAEASVIDITIANLQPHLRELQELKSQVSFRREQNDELETSRRKAQTQSLQDHQQEFSLVAYEHTMKLQLERDSFEAALKQHDENAEASQLALREQAETARQDFQSQLASIQAQARDLENEGHVRKAHQTRSRSEELTCLGDDNQRKSTSLQQELEEMRRAGEKAMISEETLQADMRSKTEAQLQMLGRKLQDRIQAARQEARTGVMARFDEEQRACQEKIAQLASESSLHLTEAEKRARQENHSHEAQVNTIRERAARDLKVSKGVGADLEKRTAATRSIAEQMQGTAEATQKAHDLELQMCDEATKAALEDLNHQEDDAKRELIRELEDTRRTCEASLNRARSECEKLSNKVRFDAMAEADKRIEASSSKIRKDIAKLQAGAADLHNRYDRAMRELEKVQKKDDLKKKDLHDLKNLQEPRRPSISSAPGSARPSQAVTPPVSGRGSAAAGLRRTNSSKPKMEGFHPLECASDRMVLEIYRTLLLERCGSVSGLEVDQRFETLRSLAVPGAAGDAACVSFDDFSRAIGRVVSSRRQCSLGEAYRHVLSLRPARLPGENVDFQACLKKALPLEDELHSHVCFLIDSAVKMSRQASGKASYALDDAVAEDEFADLFSDSRLGHCSQ